MSRTELEPLVLASASPRRQELLRYLVPTFAVLATSGEDEARFMPPALAALLPPLSLPLHHHPTLLAWRKVTAAKATGAAGIILGADTIVVVDDQVLNKPRDDAEAHAMLRQLSGRAHRVFTGIIVDHADGSAPELGLDAAEVWMAPLTEAEIAEYVATGEPLDKAGAYGIQGLGGRLVQQVIGSYTCVVGLPLGLTHKLLMAAGITGLADPAVAFQRWLADTGRNTPACTAP